MRYCLPMTPERPELEVQKFLRKNHNRDGLNALHETYAIDFKRHNEHPNLVLLKYNMIDSPMGEKIVQECRGLILDSENNWEVVAFPFEKFFNLGESHAAKIDWSQAVAEEKVDGSIITLYHYAGKWHVSTSGVPDALCSPALDHLTFAELFWASLQNGPIAREEFCEKLCENYTYVFELTTPYNRVVVRHADSRVTLLGVRNRINFHEEPLIDMGSIGAWALGVERVKQPERLSAFRGPEDVVAYVRNMNQGAELTDEGFVVVDYSRRNATGSFPRVKVKNAKYLLVHGAKDGLLSRKRIHELVRAGETAEGLAYFPELADDFLRAQARHKRLVADIELTWASLSHITDQRAFAQVATQYPFSGALFALKAKKTESAGKYLAESITFPAYLRLMEC